ncbi:MAG TPA: DNA-directed RNA polymerase subunit K [Candidatus Bathyarchaeia archaeon]|nr:DNA-directed RNA polymerase subunit K [Candidatus Bathyarchaeia archaeon]
MNPKLKTKSKAVPEAGPKVEIGPNKLTRFEKARIVGARALQIANGAPVLIQIGPGSTKPMDIALQELQASILPITIRRSLPDGASQDIPVQWLLEPRKGSSK